MEIEGGFGFFFFLKFEKRYNVLFMEIGGRAFKEFKKQCSILLYKEKNSSLDRSSSA